MTVETPTSLYQHLVATGKITADAAQLALLGRLTEWQQQLIARPPKARGLGILRGLRPGGNLGTRGFYLFGKVGRGKSMLMDVFFQSVPWQRKKRIHFHAFMHEIHQGVHKWQRQEAKAKQDDDPVINIAKRVALETDLLCLDELQVTDVADALILRRLFSELAERGVAVVFTSNRAPEDLYHGVIQRDRFLEFARFLRERFAVCELESEGDYRLRRMKAMQTVFFTPLGPAADAFLDESFAVLTNGAVAEPGEVPVNGRSVPVPAQAGDVARFSFADLCARPLGAADYRAIAEEFHAVLLSDIPSLTAPRANEARRFITLVDELYEAKVALICTAEAPPEQLYTEGTASFEFHRTVSRLIEMQSADYLAQATS